MIESEVLQEAAIMNSVLPVGDQQASTQLYYMLVLLLEGSAQRLLEHAGDGEGLLSWHRLVTEYEPTTVGRETSLLLEVLAQTFKGDVRGSLDEFEVKIRTYERSCREVLSDRVKIAVVQKGLEDDDLRRHLLMHAARLPTYPHVREELRSIMMSRDTLTGPAPMDIGANHKGKGKGKGNNKEKDPVTNPDAEVIFYYFHRKGHRKQDCRMFKGDKDKKGVHAVEQAPGLTFGAASASSVSPSRVSMIELDDWILAVSFDEHVEVVGSVERVMVDSAAAVSVCPFGYAPEAGPITRGVQHCELYLELR